jgi:hypothetical protein
MMREDEEMAMARRTSWAGFMVALDSCGGGSSLSSLDA